MKAGTINSLEPYKSVSVAMLRDIQKCQYVVFSQSALDATIGKLSTRLAEEGLGFLTVALPRLGKELDRALDRGYGFDATSARFPTREGSKLPHFLGELFETVFDNDGRLLPTPSVQSVRHLRQFCFMFYKLELPYAPELEQKVLQEFEKTDAELKEWNSLFEQVAQQWHFASHTDPWDGIQRTESLPIYDRIRELESQINDCTSRINHLEGHIRINKELEEAYQHSTFRCTLEIGFSDAVMDGLLKEVEERLRLLTGQLRWYRIVHKARILLSRLFRDFDPKDIVPSHGPGAVSTKERLHEKWKFTHVPERIAAVYPVDEYFFVNLEHVADRLQNLCRLGDKEFPAKVILVPKDSRGPRIISEEPLVNQWLQQGLFRAIVHLVEHSPLTKDEVHFTDQGPNQFGARLGSTTGRLATLDLKEASDRVSLNLVRLLFPEPLLGAMEAVRSQETELPDGRRLKYQKFAPMGSALCFPILALTIWSLLRAGLTDASHPRNYLKNRKDRQVIEEGELLVYGDDVVVPTAKAADAIAILESFGLRVNKDKSCSGEGLFRESCGIDAFRGEEVTPVKVRTAWTHQPRPEPYMSWVEYANALLDRGYLHVHDTIVVLLFQTYGPLADASWDLPVPSVKSLPEEYCSHKKRFNSPTAINQQRVERRVLECRTRSKQVTLDGWTMLLRYLVAKTTKGIMIPVSKEQQLLLNLGVYLDTPNDTPRRCGVPDTWRADSVTGPFSVQSYTERQATVLAWCWR